MSHEKLKILRKAKGLSQQEIASTFNMTQNCYSKIETGKTKLDNDRIIEFAEFFEVPPSELLNFSGISKGNKNYSTESWWKEVSIKLGKEIKMLKVELERLRQQISQNKKKNNE